LEIPDAITAAKVADTNNVRMEFIEWFARLSQIHEDKAIDRTGDAAENYETWPEKLCALMCAQLKSGVSEPEKNSLSNLSRAAILKAFQEMSDEFARRGVTGELCLFGGTVMVLAFAARPSTKDVDAVFQPTAIVREAARLVGEANGFATNWLNDAVKGFVSARHETIAGNLPQFSNLRLTMPTPEYLLAMKCMASRVGSVEGGDDVNDIIFLIRHLQLKHPAAVMDIVVSYYPKNIIPVKAQFLVEGLFAEGKI
jgi:hypothetical protein